MGFYFEIGSQRVTQGDLNLFCIPSRLSIYDPPASASQVTEIAEACPHHAQVRTVFSSTVLVLFDGITELITHALYLFLTQAWQDINLETPLDCLLEVIKLIRAHPLIWMLMELVS